MLLSPNRLLGTVVGAVYLLLGFLGFSVTPGVGFFAARGGLLLGVFEVNVASNIAHVLIGAALVLAGISAVRAAATVNSVVGGMCLVLGLAGLFLVGTAANLLALNVSDNVLHLGTAAILLAVGLGADQKPAPAPGA